MLLVGETSLATKLCAVAGALHDVLFVQFQEQARPVRSYITKVLEHKYREDDPHLIYMWLPNIMLQVYRAYRTTYSVMKFPLKNPFTRDFVV